jgi:hypothetical protein
MCTYIGIVINTLSLATISDPTMQYTCLQCALYYVWIRMHIVLPSTDLVLP